MTYGQEVLAAEEDSIPIQKLSVRTALQVIGQHGIWVVQEFLVVILQILKYVMILFT